MSRSGGRSQGAASRHGWETGGADDKYQRWNNSKTGASANGSDDYRNEMNAMGYIVEMENGFKVYHMGDTGLFGGGRVPKDDPRVEAYGEVDELNAAIGAARALVEDPELDRHLARIQDELFCVGAELATPHDAKGMLNLALAGTDPVVFLESQLLYDIGEQFEADGVPEGYYETPEGQPVVRREGTDLTIATLGEVFGWSSLIGRDRHTLSAFCSQPATVLKFERRRLTALIEKDPDSGVIFYRQLSQALARRRGNRVGQRRKRRDVDLQDDALGDRRTDRLGVEDALHGQIGDVGRAAGTLGRGVAPDDRGGRARRLRPAGQRRAFLRKRLA